jgi:hypothetical protein
MTPEELKEKLDSRPFPRVTEETINDKIAEVHTSTFDTTTICIIVMKNGFRFIGHSTPAHPDNYDEDIGVHYAYNNAFAQIWSHEGYLLREELSKQ